jgi:hypothetical protein
MIAGGVTVVEVTMTVPGAVELSANSKKEYGTSLLGSGTVTTATGRPRPPSRPARSLSSAPAFHPEVVAATKASRQALHSRRAHAHRGNHRLECRRGLREDFPCSAWAAPAISSRCLRPFPSSSSFPPAASPWQPRSISPRRRARPGRGQRPGQPGCHRCRNPGDHHRNRPRLPASAGKASDSSEDDYLSDSALAASIARPSSFSVSRRSCSALAPCPSIS